jgi:predicted amidohydrolase
MEMKMATVRFAPVPGNPDATIAKLRPLFDGAATVDLVALPELANSGYAFSSKAKRAAR